MNYIKERMEEYIYCYIWFHYGKEKIFTQKDIYQALEDDDACADLKDQLWDLFYHELPVAKVFVRIEEEKQKLKQNGMESEPEDETESETEDESDCDSE